MPWAELISGLPDKQQQQQQLRDHLKSIYFFFILFTESFFLQANKLEFTNILEIGRGGGILSHAKLMKITHILATITLL